MPRTHALEDFARDPAPHLERLRATGGAEFIVINGHRVIVQDAAAYASLIDRIDLAASNAAVAEALQQAQRGEGRDAFEVLEEIRRELRLPPDEP